jgi:hypothetical protein
VRPQLEYGSIIWDPYLKKDIEKVQHLGTIFIIKQLQVQKRRKCHSYAYYIKTKPSQRPLHVQTVGDALHDSREYGAGSESKLFT